MLYEILTLNQPPSHLTANGVKEYMKEENITFSGQEATKITVDDLKRGIDLVKSLPEIRFDHIVENCSKEELEKAFGKSKEWELKDTLYGFPVYQKNYVPKGEIWMIDNEGKVMTKFKL